MLTDWMQHGLTAVSPEAITESFLWIIAAWFLLALGLGLGGRARRLVAYTPNLLASVGILGTFVGVVVGLMGFQPQDIDHSIGSLLEGLKTAFITSLAGVFGSILFKAISATPALDRATAGPGGSPVDRLLGVIRGQSDELRRLRDAVAGAEESSLAGQLKLLRTDAHDRHQAAQRTATEAVTVLRSIDSRLEARGEAFDRFSEMLWQRLQEFAEMLSRSATEQVIEALRQVIVDFNRNLTEQFGDNFKALDAAVTRLVQWQENYRVQLEQMQAQYAQGVEAITRTEAAVAHIGERVGVIPQVMERLRQILEVQQHQLEALERHLAAFAELRDRAVEAVPEIRSGIDQALQEMEGAVKAAGDHHRRLLEEARQLTEEHDRVTREILGALQGTAGELGEQGRRLVEGLDEAMRQTTQGLAQLTEEHDRVTREILGALQGTAGELGEQGRRLVEGLDEAMRQTTQGFSRLAEAVEREAAAVQERLAGSLQEQHHRFESTVAEALQRMHEHVAQVSADLEEPLRRAVHQQLQAIDQSMQEEIQWVMEQMGQALATITGKFTEDYQKLVRAMSEVVRMGVER